MGIRLEAPRVVCLVTGAEGTPFELPDARDCASAFAAAGATGVLATALAEGVVVIADLPAAMSTPQGIAAIKQVALDAAAALAPGGNLRVGISTVCREVADYERAYGEAEQVIACLTQFGTEDQSVLAADDMGAGRLLLASANAPAVERFARETLGPLLADGENAADLVTTLTAFFDEGRSIRRAATALDVHENTIRYRLGRIEDAIGLPIATDADAQLTAQMAILVLRLQGRIPARTVPQAVE
jgi:DNA-binding PucR family transcriptional regulator